MTETIVTTQATSKRFKGAKMSATVLLFMSPLIGIGAGSFGVFLVCVVLGIGLAFYARIGSYWNNR